MQLRPYQRETIDAINTHLAESDSNPLAVLPTAGGKTIVFATMIREWLEAWPETRVCILAHVKELLGQAEDKLKRVWPAAPVGVFSAGMGRREGHRNIMIAGIQSVHRRACDFDPFDIVIVDEAHLIPLRGEGMYRRFLKESKMCNPRLRVIGFTATPFRLDGGHIAGPDNILNEVCYSASIPEMIRDGFICKLTSKAGVASVDVSGIKISNGDYVANLLEAAVDTDAMVSQAVGELVKLGANRKTWLVFCAGVKHAHHVSRELSKHGIDAPIITGETSAEHRAQLIGGFDHGRIRALVNVNVLTTGLDVTRIDLIAMLRPTMSASLYVQMVGRGFRLHPEKENCLILDFAGNVMEHGPVDAVEVRARKGGKKKDQDPPAKMCPQCRELVACGFNTCPCCGFEFPPREIHHDIKPGNVPILSEPETVNITGVEVNVHAKEGNPDSLRVRYQSGMSEFSEFICFQHSGFAAAKAAHWWKRRFGEPIPKTAMDAVQDMFLAAKIADLTESILVLRRGKYTEIKQVNFKRKLRFA